LSLSILPLSPFFQLFSHPFNCSRIRLLNDRLVLVIIRNELL
jgi:hypothetical protein